MHWIIGDIHGMLRPLTALVQRVRMTDPDALLLFVGDYVNRGPDSRGVLDFLIKLDNARFCRGNHDDVFDFLLHGRSYIENPSAPDQVSAFRWFVQHGLWETMRSYEVPAAEIDRAFVMCDLEAVKKVMSVVPTAHRDFVRALKPVIELPEFFVAHAMWDPSEPDESIGDRLESDTRLRHQILWGRYGRELQSPKRWRRTGYFGHTPVQTYPRDMQNPEHAPIRGPNIVLLDTAVALTAEGRLSAVCAETGQTLQVNREGNEV